MAGAATIIIAHHDLSLAGGNDGNAVARRPAEIERHFFDLVRARHPDVIVLDCRGEESRGVASVQKIRKRADTPILIICAAADSRQRDYRIAGASDCLDGPFDIVGFNQAIQNIIRVSGRSFARAAQQSGTFEMAGLIFEPGQNELVGADARLKLTTAECRLLMHLLRRPWMVCSRADLAEAIYGANAAASDRAIDVVVTRLRKKLTQLRGAAANNLIRTEFRQGYMFVGDVAASPSADTTERVAAQ